MTSEYSQHTITRYNQAISSIIRLYEDNTSKKYKFPETLHDEIDIIIKILTDTYESSTLHNFISAVLWCLTTYNTDNYDIQYIENIKQKYRVVGKNIKEEIERNNIGKEFDLTEREQKTFLIWEDILKVYDKMLQTLDTNDYNNFLEFVIISLYVLHPPARADYANMKVFIADSLIPQNYDENYCVLQTNPRFVFNKYKTSKKKGQQIIEIDDTLHNILLDWMELNKSDYLLSSFIKSKNEYKPFTEGTLCRRITLIFEKYANTPATINTLRHSHISYMNKHEVHNHENRVDCANKMMHSLSMADKYRRMVYL